MAPEASVTRSRAKWPKYKQQKAMARPCDGGAVSTSSTQDQELCNVKNAQQDNGEEEDIFSKGNDCATPKAKRFRIPEVLTCPPAPKKRRVMANCLSNRSPIAFFASPDIELFFFSALTNVSSASS